MRNGILKAIELNYKYVCRTRTDIFPENHLKFLQVTRNLYEYKIMSLCGVELYMNNELLTYYLDVILVGSIARMFKYYEKDDEFGKSYFRNCEQIMIENYANKDIRSREDIKQYMNFCKNICSRENIEIIWYKPAEWVDYCRSIPYMKLIGEYCNSFFVYE